MRPSTKDSDKPKTLYQVVIDDILDRINNGAFSFDKPICTESRLMEQYSISRITARRAMTELENQGILYRKRGVGSFVVRDIYQRRQPAQNVSRIFAFIFPFDVSRSGLTASLHAANNVLIPNGYAVSTYITESDAKTRGRTFLTQLINMDVAGVAYYPKTSDVHLELLNHLVFHGKPVVIIDIPNSCRYLSSVSSDNFSGGTQLTEHLLDLGHRRIAYLTGIPIDERITVCDRFSGYVLALDRAGIPLDDGLIVTNLTEGFRRAPAIDGAQSQLHHTIQNLIARGATALLCEHDQLAFEAAIACREMGIRVPGQLSICGFDDSEWARMLPEGITTMAQDMEQVGTQAAELLLAGLSAPLSAARQVVIPTKLIARGTTGAVAKDSQPERAEGEK